MKLMNNIYGNNPGYAILILEKEWISLKSWYLFVF